MEVKEEAKKEKVRAKEECKRLREEKKRAKEYRKKTVEEQRRVRQDSSGKATGSCLIISSSVYTYMLDIDPTWSFVNICACTSNIAIVPLQEFGDEAYHYTLEACFHNCVHAGV